MRMRRWWKFPPELKEKIKELYLQRKLVPQIAKILNLPKVTVKKQILSLHQGGMPRIYMGKYYPNLAPTDLELFEETDLRLERKKIYEKFQDRKPKKILNLADFHIPFHNSDAIKEAIKEDADLVVISGDFLDFYSISKFRKSKLILLEREITDGLSILKVLSDKYPHIIMITANHERRLLKMLQNRFADRLDLVERFKDACSVLEQMSKEFKNIYVINGWWLKIGDAIFCHPDWYQKTQGRVALSSYEYFTEEREDFRAILNSHTHRFNDNIAFGKRLMEVPCLCVKMDYARDGHRYAGKWVLGYAIVKQAKDGYTNFKETGLKFLGYG